MNQAEEIGKYGLACALAEQLGINPASDLIERASLLGQPTELD